MRLINYYGGMLLPRVFLTMPLRSCTVFHKNIKYTVKRTRVRVYTYHAYYYRSLNRPFKT